MSAPRACKYFSTFRKLDVADAEARIPFLDRPQLCNFSRKIFVNRERVQNKPASFFREQNFIRQSPPYMRNATSRGL